MRSQGETEDREEISLFGAMSGRSRQVVYAA